MGIDRYDHRRVDRHLGLDPASNQPSTTQSGPTPGGPTKFAASSDRQSTGVVTGRLPSSCRHLPERPVPTASLQEITSPTTHNPNPRSSPRPSDPPRSHHPGTTNGRRVATETRRLVHGVAFQGRNHWRRHPIRGRCPRPQKTSLSGWTPADGRRSSSAHGGQVKSAAGRQQAGQPVDRPPG